VDRICKGSVNACYVRNRYESKNISLFSPY